MEEAITYSAWLRKCWAVEVTDTKFFLLTPWFMLRAGRWGDGNTMSYVEGIVVYGRFKGLRFPFQHGTEVFSRILYGNVRRVETVVEFLDRTRH